MSQTAKKSAGLTQRQAEILGRQFNSAVTNTSAYGSDHPVSERAYETFLAGIGEFLELVDPITLMLDRGSFFVEDHSVDAKFNSGRLAIVFRKLNLESVTFRNGLDADALKQLMDVLTNPDDFVNIGMVREALSKHGVDSIKVNHVVLRKFTSDDEVISREGLEDLTDLAEQAVSSGGKAGETGPVAEDLMARVENIFSMRALMQQPGQVAEQLLDASIGDTQRQAGVVAQIRQLGEQVDRGAGDDGEALSLDSVMQAVSKVREEFSRGLAGQEETARLMAESGSVLSELDQLTCQTVVSIVRDEYRAGEVSAKRLAQIIRRVLPESRDLKRLLPMLKQALLNDGMPLTDYIEFVNQLTGELQSDDLVQMLEQGADSIGFSVDELLREIRREPEEAARLIVLASELRQGGRDDENVLSSALSEYIDRVSGELVRANGDLDQGSLREEIKKTQKTLIREVGEHGVSRAIAERIEADLDAHVDRSTSTFRTSRIMDLLNKSQSTDDSELTDRLVQIVERRPNLSTLGNTLQRELKSHGYSPDRIDSIYSETLARLKRKSRVEFIPGAVMNPVATAYFMQREIATSTRYGTIFSGIMLMIAQVHDNETDWRTISTEDIESLMPEVFDLLPPHLRDLDLLGTLGSSDRNIPLAILPMTNQEGADAVMGRMLEALEQAHLELSGKTVKVNVIGTAAQFDPEKSSDTKSFVQWMKGRLATQLVTRLKSS